MENGKGLVRAYHTLSRPVLKGKAGLALMPSDKSSWTQLLWIGSHSSDRGLGS